MHLVECAGAMALIAKGLVQAKPLALEAYRLLSCILTAPMQPIARHELLSLLADMQGVRRLSNLLCPTLDSKDGHEFGTGMFVLFTTHAMCNVDISHDWVSTHTERLLCPLLCLVLAYLLDCGICIAAASKVVSRGTPLLIGVHIASL